MKVVSFLILSLVCILYLHIPPVEAGGGNVMVTPLNMGMVKEKGVEIIVTVFEPIKNKLDWPELNKYAVDVTGYEPVGVIDLELELQFESPLANQQCIINGSNKTNEYGQVRATCYSDTVGDFIIKTVFKSDKPLYEGGPSAKDASRTVSIRFDKRVTPAPTATPKTSATPYPSPSAVPTPSPSTDETEERLSEFEQQNEEQKQQIDELKTKLETQEKDVSALKKMMNQIQSFFRRFFR